MQYLLVLKKVSNFENVQKIYRKKSQKVSMKIHQKCPQEFTHKISPIILHFCPLEFFHPIWSLKLYNCNFNKKYWIQSTFNSSYTMKCQTSWLIKEKVLLFMHCKLLGGLLTEKKYLKGYLGYISAFWSLLRSFN